MIAFEEKTEQAADVGSRMLLERANRCDCEDDQLALRSRDRERAVIIRTALFGLAQQRGRRSYINRELLAHWRRCDVRYIGQRLNSSDEDIWMHVLHLARQQDFSTENGVRFTARSFIRAFGGTTYRSAYANYIREALERFRATSVIIRTETTLYVGGLIDRFVYDKATGQYAVFIDPKIAGLFGIETESLDPDPIRRVYRASFSSPNHKTQSLTHSPRDRRAL